MHRDSERRRRWADKMKKRKRRIKYTLNTLFILLLLGGTGYILFKDQEIPQILDTMSEANPFLLLLGLAMVFFFVCSESVIIKYLMKSFKCFVPFTRCIQYSFIGFFFSSITPSASGGQPLQVYYMGRDGIDIAVSTLVLLVVTMVYKLVLVLLCLVVFLTKGAFIAAHIDGAFRYILYIGIILNAFLVILMGVLIFSPSLAEKAVKKIIPFLGRIRLVRRPEKRLEKTLRSIEKYRYGSYYMKTHISVLCNVFLITVFQRLCFFIIPYLVYKAFGLSGTSAYEIITLQILIALAVDILPFPGGIGINENSFVALYVPIFGEALILPGMLLSRGINFYALVIISACFTVYAHFNRKKFGAAEHTKISQK